MLSHNEQKVTQIWNSFLLSSFPIEGDKAKISKPTGILGLHYITSLDENELIPLKMSFFRLFEVRQTKFWARSKPQMAVI